MEAENEKRKAGSVLFLHRQCFVASPMAAGMTETVQAEELTVDSKVVPDSGREHHSESGSSSRKRGVVCSVWELTFYGEERKAIVRLQFTAISGRMF